MLPTNSVPETGRECDRLEQHEIQLACANRQTLMRLRDGMCDRLSHNRHVEVAVDLADEAIAYLDIAISGYESPDYPDIPW